MKSIELTYKLEGREMLIVSQNEDTIINFDNVEIIDIVADLDGTGEVLYKLYYETSTKREELGKYEKEERAKEVLKEIQERYEHMQYLKCFNRLNDLYEVGIKDFAYEMPKE